MGGGALGSRNLAAMDSGRATVAIVAPGPFAPVGVARGVGAEFSRIDDLSLKCR